MPNLYLCDCTRYCCVGGRTEPKHLKKSTWYRHAPFRTSTQPSITPIDEFLRNPNVVLPPNDASRNPHVLLPPNNASSPSHGPLSSNASPPNLTPAETRSSHPHFAPTRSRSPSIGTSNKRPRLDSAGGSKHRFPNNTEDPHPWDDVPNAGRIVELDSSRAEGDSGNMGERLFLEDNEDIVRHIVYIQEWKQRILITTGLVDSRNTSRSTPYTNSRNESYHAAFGAR